MDDGAARPRARWTVVAALGISAALVAVLLFLPGNRPDRVDPPAPANPADVYDPVVAGEALPVGYRVGLERDQIVPVYRPEFTSAGGVDWPDEMLVIGVAEASEAKAYPVTHLNRREMVIDSLNGIPILVTW